MIPMLTPWGPLCSAPRLVAERENRVFEVSIESIGRAALRLHRKGYQTAAAIEAELRWTQELAARGFFCPSPFETLEGTLLGSVDGHVASLIRWIDAPEMADVPVGLPHKLDRFEAVGRLLKQLHDLTALIDVSGYERPLWDHDGLLGEAPFWGRFWENPALSHGEARDLQRGRDAAGEWLSTQTPGHLIHADVLQENILLHEDGLCLIDYDDAGFGYPGYDLGTALIQSHDDVDLPQIAEALCQGYEMCTPEDALKFMALRGFASCGWAVPRYSATAPELRIYAERALSAARPFL